MLEFLIGQQNFVQVGINDDDIFRKILQPTAVPLLCVKQQRGEHFDRHGSGLPGAGPGDLVQFTNPSRVGGGFRMQNGLGSVGPNAPAGGQTLIKVAHQISGRTVFSCRGHGETTGLRNGYRL